MKRVISALLVCVLLVASVFAMASCGKMLSGKYEFDAVVGGKTYDFSGNKVTITYELLGLEKSVEGTYKIADDEDGKTTITFTFDAEEEDADDFAGEFSFSDGEEDGVKYIKIGGVKYTKAD